MAEPPPISEAPADTYRTPRWVKVFAIAAAAVILLLALLILARGSGGHGPGRHLRSSPTSDAGPPIGLPAVHAARVLG